MSFSDLQVRRLKAKLEARRVKTRAREGRELSYVEGWYVMAEANRIFGFDGWDRLSHSQQLLYERPEAGLTEVAYLARVRVIVRAGANSVVREGSGFGRASNVNAGEAHELALKAAETDATKRALATFGNRFGLALYDKDQAGVAKPSPGSRGSNGAGDASAGKLVPAPAFPHRASSPLRSDVSDAADESKAQAEDGTGPEGLHTALIFLKALRERLRRALSNAELEDIMARASVELERVRDRHPDLRDRRGTHMVDVVGSIVALKRQELENGIPSISARRGAKVPSLSIAIDKSRLAFATVKRYRDKDHLKRVAALPCVICGRMPAQAHHLRFAQVRGMGLKVSDEFTVPLCAIDHDALHRSGNEEAWWTAKQMNPLPLAHALWAQSRERVSTPAASASPDATPAQ